MPRTARRYGHPRRRGPASRTALASALAWAAIATPSLYAQEPEQPRTPVDTESVRLAAQGWIDLLADNGSAWREFGERSFPSASWRIVGGTELRHIAGSHPADLVTKREFANFEFRFDWRIEAGTNSGVMYRVGEVAELAPDECGFEYQILDDEGHPGASTKQNAGALYELYESLGKTLHEVGEWNTGRIVCLDDRIEHWMNGSKVVEAPLGSKAFAEVVENSKFRELAEFGTAPRGRLCLQGLGQSVAFRRLYVRELTPPKSRWSRPVTLFDGSDLDSWIPRVPAGTDPSSVWTIAEDGRLECSGHANAAYLHTRRAFGSFLLSLDWRLTDPDPRRHTARVLLRAQGPHRIWPRAFAVDLSEGVAGELRGYGRMRAGKGRRVGNTVRRTHGAERKVGDWNRLQVIANEGWIQVIVNGQVVNEAWDCTFEPGLLALTCEGGAVDFRDVVVTPLDEPAPAPR